MDVLSSIMSSMDKPPSLSEKEKLIIKSKNKNLPNNSNDTNANHLTERKEEIEKRQVAEKERLEKFKNRIEAKFKSYFSDPKNINLKFEPMDHVYRSIM